MQVHITINIPDRLTSAFRKAAARKAVASVIMVGIVASTLIAYAVTFPHTFTAGSTASSTEVNANFTALKNAVDGLEAKGQWEKNGTTLQYNGGNVVVDTQGTTALFLEGTSANAKGTLSTTDAASGGPAEYPNPTLQIGFPVAEGSARDVVIRSNGQNHLTVKGTGNVGIGTSTPSQKLHVAGGSVLLSNNQYLRMERTSGVAQGVLRISATDFTELVAGDTGTGIQLAASDGITKWMTVRSGGNVGIGTTAPAQLLEVANDSEATGKTQKLRITSTSTGGESISLGAGVNASTVAFSSTGSLWIAPRADVNASVAYDASTDLAIDSSGKLGLGIQSPAQKLEVNGGMRLNTATAKPTCDVTSRGTFWVTQGAASVKDAVEVCAKDAIDTYAWRVIY